MAVEAGGSCRDVLTVAIDQRLLRRRVDLGEEEDAADSDRPQEHQGSGDGYGHVWMLPDQR